MKHSTFSKAVIVCLVAILAHAPSAFAACNQDQCLGACNYEELLYDTGFQGNCAYWVFTGNTTRANVGSNYFADLYGNGTVYQEVNTNTYQYMEIGMWIDIISNDPGTERLRLEILSSSGTILETVEIFDPNDADGRYDFPIDNYSNSTIRVRLRYIGGLAPGDTTFRIDTIALYGVFP